MISPCVDIHSHEGEGFKILVQYQSWRTAMLNTSTANRLDSFGYVERHRETDEVFVLLRGTAYLIIGGDTEKPDSYEVLPMDLCKTYNVRVNVWHGVIMSVDASLYIVENINTGKDNSDHYYLASMEKELILSHISL